MKETIRRAARTFLQAAAGYIVANVAAVLAAGAGDIDVIKTGFIGLGVSAVAAGIAALMNLPTPPTVSPESDTLDVTNDETIETEADELRVIIDEDDDEPMAAGLIEDDESKGCDE